MDVPLTSTGKPCKLCKARGRKCHLHGGTPKTPGSRSPKSGRSSPKSPRKSPKSSPRRYVHPDTKVVADLDDLFGTFESPGTRTNRKSPLKTPTEFHYLERLPMPALQQVLLNMEWFDLRRVCAHVPRAFQICKSHNFREMYMARNVRGIFVTPVKLVGKEFAHDNRTRLAYIEYEDANKTEIEIFDDPSPFSPHITIKWRNGAWLSFYMSGDDIVFLPPRIYENTDDEDDENHIEDAKKFFDLIKHPEWYGKYEKGGKHRNEILKLVVLELKAILRAEVDIPKKLYDKFDKFLK